MRFLRMMKGLNDERLRPDLSGALLLEPLCGDNKKRERKAEKAPKK